MTCNKDDGSECSTVRIKKNQKINHGSDEESSSDTSSCDPSCSDLISDCKNDTTRLKCSATAERSCREDSPCPSNQSEQDHTSDKPILPNRIINEKDLSRLDPRNSDVCKAMSPDMYIQKLFEVLLGFLPMARPTLELSSLSYNDSQVPFISPIAEDDMANYDVDIVTATRDQELDVLRSMYENGRSLSCCNRYGESLLHMACRRGFTDIVKFLIQEANVQIRVTDDCGRTPLHDALWNRNCQFAIVDLLLNLDPSLFLLCDKHGHTPFMYARREHWGVWKQFLWDRREYMMNAMNSDVMKLFKVEL